MAIVKMKRLRMAAMKQDREQLLELLQRMGCVEIDEPSPDTDDPVWAELKRPDGDGLSAAREKHTAAEKALDVLKRYAPEKKGMLTPKPELAVERLLSADGEDRAVEQTETINELDRRMAAIHAETAKKQTELQALSPWLELDLPLETQSTALVTILMGTLPATVPFDQAEQAVRAEGELAQLTKISEDRERQYLLLVCHASQEEGVMAAMKQFGWSRANLSAWTGTAKANTARLEQEIETLAQELGSIQQKLAEMGAQREEIRRLSDRYETQENLEENRSRALDTDKVFFLQGWVPEEDWPALRKALEGYPAAAEAEDPTEEEYAQVPVRLKNNWFTRPLNMVTEMYSLPAYGTVDPNPLMAPFFILFYGIMMADMGYGLVMLLLGLTVGRKKKPTGMLAHMCGLLVWCGISTFCMGALTGGFFGDFLSQLAVLINPESTFALPALFTPLEDTMMILVGAMALGAVQIITGMAISFYRKVKAGQFMDALWEEVTWWLVLAGLALAVLGVTNVVLIVGGIMVLIGSGWNAKGFGKVTAVFGSLYNHVTGYFGDILSYSRLMALMLAGSVIAQVFNTLGAIPGNIIIFILISFVGNTLNFGLNLLGCYVHDLRLQCLEYFGKFYEDGGKPFRPMDMKSKYYRIVK